MNDEVKNDEWKERECGALWAHTSKAGNTYSTGYVELDGKRLQVIVLKNKYKQKGERTPDARIYVDDRPSKDSQSGENQVKQVKEDPVPI